MKCRNMHATGPQRIAHVAGGSIYIKRAKPNSSRHQKQGFQEAGNIGVPMPPWVIDSLATVAPCLSSVRMDPDNVAHVSHLA